MVDKKSPAELLSSSKPHKSKRPSKPPNRRKTPWISSLRKIRKSIGLTLDDVSNAVGMSKVGYWELEQGCDPLLTTAFKLSTFFDRDISEIWSQEDADLELKGGA